MLDALDETSPLSDVGGDDFLSQFADIGNEPAEVVAPAAEEIAPPAAQDEEPPAADVDDLEGIPEELTGKASVAAKDNFKKLRESATKYKKEATDTRTALEAKEKDLAAREARIAELEKSVAKLPELEEKTKFVEEAERELAVSRVEGTQEYKRTIEQPLTAIANAAEQIAKDNGIDFDKLISAIAERDPAKRREGLKEVITGLDDLDKQEIIRMSQDTQQLLTKQAEIRERAADARKEVEELAREKETKAQAQAREAFESSAKTVVSDLQKKIPFLSLAEGETAEGVFAKFAEDVAKVNLDTADPRTKAYAAAAGALLPRVVKQFRQVAAELETYKNRVKEKASSAPTVGGVAPPPRRTDGDLMEATAAFLGLKSSGTGNPLDGLE